MHTGLKRSLGYSYSHPNLRNWPVQLLIICILFFAQHAFAQQVDIGSITIEAAQKKVDVNGLSESQLKRIAQLTQYELRSVISIYISEDYTEENSMPLAVAGDIEFSPKILQFIPHIPFFEGQMYLVVLSLQPIDEILLLEEFFTVVTETSSDSESESTSAYTPIEHLFNAAKLLKESLNEK